MSSMALGARSQYGSHSQGCKADAYLQGHIPSSEDAESETGPRTEGETRRR
jgi:hypothetical protein